MYRLFGALLTRNSKRRPQHRYPALDDPPITSDHERQALKNEAVNEALHQIAQAARNAGATGVTMNGFRASAEVSIDELTIRLDDRD